MHMGLCPPAVLYNVTLRRPGQQGTVVNYSEATYLLCENTINAYSRAFTVGCFLTAAYYIWSDVTQMPPADTSLVASQIIYRPKYK